MLTFGLMTALTLAIQVLLAEGAAIDRKDEKNGLPAGPTTTTGCRFCHCRLPPAPTRRDVIAARLCVRKTLEAERAGPSGLRARRSLGSKLHPKSILEDVDALLYTAGGKHRLPRSLEALCAGDLSQYDHEVREYITWRCKNGYGQLMRRWGRSAPASHRYFRFYENEAGQTGSADDASKVNGYKLSYKDRAKRDDADELRAIVEAYREWRSQNGYGQSSGRWG